MAVDLESVATKVLPHTLHFTRLPSIEAEMGETLPQTGQLDSGTGRSSCKGYRLTDSLAEDLEPGLFRRVEHAGILEAFVDLVAGLREQPADRIEFLPVLGHLVVLEYGADLS